MAAPEMLLRGLWASHAVPTSVTSVADSPVSSEGDLDVSALDTVDMNSVSPTMAILEEGRHLDTETSGNNRTRKGALVYYDVSEHVCDDDDELYADGRCSDDSTGSCDGAEEKEVRCIGTIHR